MDNNWFKKRMIPAKQSSELWIGFANAVQSLIEAAILPLIERTANRKSVFTMESEDLSKRISELGRFFYINEENGSSLPVLLQQRLDEIHFKGTSRPIESTLWREFKNINATWMPLYAPLDQDKYPYGSYFATKDEMLDAQATYGDFFMTSRGRIEVALNDVYDTYSGVNPEEALNEFVRQFKLVVEPIIPLTIVFDGMGYNLSFEVFEKQITCTLIGISSEILDGTWQFPKQTSSVAINKLSTEISLDGTVSLINRSLQTPIYRFDDMRLDAWGLDAIAAPVITPQSTLPDGRFIIVDNVCTLQTLGFRGCIVEFTDGEIYGGVFPDGADFVLLPIPAHLVPGIKSILYRDTY